MKTRIRAEAISLEKLLKTYTQDHNLCIHPEASTIVHDSVAPYLKLLAYVQEFLHEIQ